MKFQENFITLKPLIPLGLAERVVDMYREHLYYLSETKTWMAWNGNKFQPCTEETLIKKVRDCIEKLPMELTINQIGKARNKIITHQKLIEAAESNMTTGRLKEIIRILPTIDGVIANPDSFNSSQTLINCKNGILDMKTGDIIQSDPQYLLSQKTSVDYNPGATCKTFDNFILEICNNDTELMHYLQVFCGYLFTGLTREQKLFVFYGLGANGKSLLISILLSIAGDYGLSTPASTLLAGHTGAIRNDYARLVNSRIVAATETSRGQKFDEAGVKMLTGEDRIVSRKLYQEYFEYLPKFKVLLAVNNLPRIFGNDKGIKRRICIIPFMRTFENRNCDKNLKRKLSEESDGIFNWIIEGAKIYLQEGLPECKLVLDATTKYLDEMDEIQNFLTDCCNVETDNRTKRTPIATLFSKYQSWGKMNGIEPVGIRVFGDSVKSKGITQGKSGKFRQWIGITIRM